MSAALANLLQRRVRLQSCIDSRHLLFVVHSSRCDRFVPSIAIRLITGSSCNFSSQQQQRPKLPNKGNEQVLELGARTVIAPVKRKRRFEWSGGAIALLSIPLISAGLGWWQIYRRRWKLDMIERYRARIDEPAIPFPVDNIDQLKDYEYKRVSLTGEFLHDKEFLIQKKSRIDRPYRTDLAKKDVKIATMLHGCNVITPFKIANTEFVCVIEWRQLYFSLIVLINRGWLPSERQSVEKRKEGQISGTVTLEAVVRQTASRSMFMARNEPESGKWRTRDIVAMATRYRSDPIYLEACYESNVPGGPIGGQTYVAIRNEHHTYILIWFGIAVITQAMWFIRFYK